MSGSSQISPRVLSAFGRLDEVVNRLQRLCEKQSHKVDGAVVENLHSQVKGLQEDNLALSEALEAYHDADYDSQFESMKEEIAGLREEKSQLEEANSTLKSREDEFAVRLEKLIGNVQQVLEEEEA